MQNSLVDVLENTLQKPANAFRTFPSTWCLFRSVRTSTRMGRRGYGRPRATRMQHTRTFWALLEVRLDVIPASAPDQRSYISSTAARCCRKSRRRPTKMPAASYTCEKELRAMDIGHIQDDLIRELMLFIAGADFQSAFEAFFLKHALRFTDDDEHKLEYTDLFMQFQDLFERFMKGSVAFYNLMKFMRRRAAAEPKQPAKRKISSSAKGAADSTDMDADEKGSDGAAGDEGKAYFHDDDDDHGGAKEAKRK
ncbi:hypothetical protein DYB32_007046 [Aphanomyces invadans]|uniref:BART domain-containing protein n=1 Tax=Aphanomyces invadans TaxID=157072 RepID=A0A418APM1_9STRA|nr:hypothetical protein DYB32_007046 [Aphanomyces invadans]